MVYSTITKRHVSYLTDLIPDSQRQLQTCKVWVWWMFKVFPHVYTNTLLPLCSKQLLKSLWQKEKLLTMNNFSICHNVLNFIQWVFYHFLRVSIFFRWFQSRLVQIFCIWERVKLYEVVYIYIFKFHDCHVMPMIIELNWLVVWSLVDKHIQGLYIISYLLALNCYATLPNYRISSNDEVR